MIVRKSNIHGFGVFADRRYFIGERVLEFCGQEVDIPDHHTITIDGIYVRLEGIQRYINHSPEPNCAVDGYLLRAISRIEEDDEITFNYQMGMWEFRRCHDIIKSIKLFQDELKDEVK